MPSCRDYALSGRTESLKPYEAALAQLNATMQVLRRDLAANPNRSRQFHELEPVVNARLETIIDNGRLVGLVKLENLAEHMVVQTALTKTSKMMGSCPVRVDLLVPTGRPSLQTRAACDL